jgi:hypothetical protein
MGRMIPAHPGSGAARPGAQHRRSAAPGRSTSTANPQCRRRGRARDHYPAGTFDVGTFKASPFLGQFGVVAGYQISWAIYVSDYSRYLPPDVTVRKTFYWTYWGFRDRRRLDVDCGRHPRRMGWQGF